MGEKPQKTAGLRVVFPTGNGMIKDTVFLMMDVLSVVRLASGRWPDVPIDQSEYEKDGIFFDVTVIYNNEQLEAKNRL